MSSATLSIKVGATFRCFGESRLHLGNDGVRRFHGLSDGHHASWMSHVLYIAQYDQLVEFTQYPLRGFAFDRSESFVGRVGAVVIARAMNELAR